MKMSRFFIAAAGLMLATTGISATASAQPYPHYSRYDRHHDRHDRHDRYDRYDRHRPRAYRHHRYYRHHYRDCHWVVRHHHRFRVCR